MLQRGPKCEEIFCCHQYVAYFCHPFGSNFNLWSFKVIIQFFDIDSQKCGDFFPRFRSVSCCLIVFCWIKLKIKLNYNSKNKINISLKKLFSPLFFLNFSSPKCMTEAVSLKTLYFSSLVNPKISNASSANCMSSLSSMESTLTWMRFKSIFQHSFELLFKIRMIQIKLIDIYLGGWVANNEPAEFSVIIFGENSVSSSWHRAG